MRMSIRITSGRRRSASATASAPFSASPTTSISGLGLEDRPEAAAHERLVVADQDADAQSLELLERQPRADRVAAPGLAARPSARRRTAPRARACRSARARVSPLTTAGARPSSRTSSSSASATYRTLTCAREASACLSVLVSASWTIRYAHSPIPSGSSRGSPSTDSSTASPVSRTWPTSSSRYSIPGCGAYEPALVVLLGADHAEQPAQLGQRRAPGRGHRRQRFARARRVGVEHVLTGRGLHDHHADVVGDHVVQLARDPGAFLGHCPLGLLLALALEARRAGLELGQVCPARADVVADTQAIANSASFGNDSTPGEARC